MRGWSFIGGAGEPRWWELRSSGEGPALRNRRLIAEQLPAQFDPGHGLDIAPLLQAEFSFHQGEIIGAGEKRVPRVIAELEDFGGGTVAGGQWFAVVRKKGVAAVGRGHRPAIVPGNIIERAATDIGSNIATGSYNWETPAETGNDENLLVIYNARINNLYYQEFMARYRESGGVLLGTGTGEKTWEAPDGLSMDQNYPNPFYPTTKIKYTIAKPGIVKIEVFDLMGCQVQAHAINELQPGTHVISFDGSSLNDGVYFCRISAGGYSVTWKMVVGKNVH